ncbi:MAG: aconitase family protein [candidate division KSB1 bacterium]|nr:aconitase family protein [candidate division KSB1 bacterium]MDZ7274681.1 aconitase family protein [candidate division KSB1 bacterium]MDZ7285506.1 aconitase family protein [candidate division KSB1 bacterium]MDZ7298538.1 aconitase family protein [candidate division KSB1 bacterium]MDZ7306610.1 aconitase family protein [candidate division KSB1 bacterium]
MTSPRPMTLTEKILLQHALGWERNDVQAGDILAITVDWTIASELAWNGMNLTYEALGRPPLFNRDRFYLALDHTVDAGTLASDTRTQNLVQLARGFAREAKLKYFYDANQTIMHTEFFRQLVRPGEIVLGADSHTSSHGGMAALAIGLGGADIVAAMVRGYSWLQVPEAIRVHYAGALPFGLTGKDVILKTLGQLGRNTVAMERTVEFSGDHLEDFSTDFRFTIANMTAELGGLNGIFPADGRVRQTMQQRRDPQFREGGWWFTADADAAYVATFRIDLAGLEPQVARPYSPDNVVSVTAVAGQPLDGCFIGACTTTEEELILAALVLEAALEQGKQPVASPNRIVVPGSLEIAQHLQEKGLLEIYRRAGFRINEPGCSMCLGIASERAQPGEVWLSSQNRNFPNRMGKGSIAWLASALTVAASAFDLKISDPRPDLARLDRDRVSRLMSAKSGLPEVVYTNPRPPAAGTVTEAGRVAAGQAPPALLTGRAQLFGDHVDTDAIIAGEFCHLSDLKEIGAKAFHYFRPDFVQRVAAGENIIVAGEGWGSGSSREHAVWALKGAGVQAVIARSFAYIHKRNLVNEALPFLILPDEEFYRRVRDGDLLQLDLAAATVTLDGTTYQAAALPPVMRRIIQSGGLVANVKQELESIQGASAI